jgi:hypothetical protein
MFVADCIQVQMRKKDIYEQVIKYYIGSHQKLQFTFLICRQIVNNYRHYWVDRNTSFEILEESYTNDDWKKIDPQAAYILNSKFTTITYTTQSDILKCDKSVSTSCGDILNKISKVIVQYHAECSQLLKEIPPIIPKDVNIFWFPHRRNTMIFSINSLYLKEFVIPVPFSLLL